MSIASHSIKSFCSIVNYHFWPMLLTFTDESCTMSATLAQVKHILSTVSEAKSTPSSFFICLLSSPAFDADAQDLINQVDELLGILHNHSKMKKSEWAEFIVISQCQDEMRELL